MLKLNDKIQISLKDLEDVIDKCLNRYYLNIDLIVDNSISDRRSLREDIIKELEIFLRK
jgi:hypothetical protein